MIRNIFIALSGIVMIACSGQKQSDEKTTEIKKDTIEAIKPVVTTQKVRNDSDDPAIWINKDEPENSLIVGTDKGDDNGVGGLYVFNLRGEIINTVDSIMRPNNVDIAYGLDFNGEKIDIAVCTERYKQGIRIFKLPEMTPVDGGGIEVFVGDSLRATMGAALFTDPATSQIYAIVGRKEGPMKDYLWQYRLKDSGTGAVVAELVRKFGNFSGVKEIEAIAVDNELGYVYYSDETVGVKKYYAHPDSSGVELAHFGKEGFTDDHEGISIYKTTDSTGYILVSDQQANKFRVFSRQGSNSNPHNHELIEAILFSTVESDGNDVTHVALGEKFPEGLFVAMSDDGTFQLYDWRDIAAKINSEEGKE